jgi:hypothetical protein
MEAVLAIGLLLMLAFVCGAALPAAADVLGSDGLTLTVYNNTGLGAGPGAPEQRTVPGLAFTIPLERRGALSAELTGTMSVTPGASYAFNCSFGAAQLGSLHVDDHLVCQFGANSDSVLVPGQGSKRGCGGGGGHHPCDGIDNPLAVMSRTELPLRLSVLYNPALALAAAPSSLVVGVSASATTGAGRSRDFYLHPALPPLEQRRRAMQRGLLQGWGLFYDMSYTDVVLLPQGARLKLGLCETGAGGKCLSEARIDWPDKAGLSSTIRPGLHAYDRSYTQMWVAAGGCNVSIETGGGGAAGGPGGLNILVAVVDEAPAAAVRQEAAQCGTKFLPNTDWPGHDLVKVPHVSSKEACCALCANTSTCAAGSWDGPGSKWAATASCNLKTAAPPSGKVAAAGLWGFTVRPAAPPPAARGCDGLALVPTGLTTWFRENTVTATATASRGGGGTARAAAEPDAIHFRTSGNLGGLTVYATQPSALLRPGGLADSALTSHPHLAFQLSNGFKLGLSSATATGRGAEGGGRTLAAIEATLAAAREAELATYSRFGRLAETKAAVQAAVMWQLIYNPLEQGPFAPVIRGNPWGLDKGVVNDDWPYVIFDWDNHFGAFMLSLDAKELGYSALIQVLKAKTAEGFVPNTAASVNKARHSQPPVGSKVLWEMHRKYNESWVVELLFDDLLDWNVRENARRPPPALSTAAPCG